MTHTSTLPRNYKKISGMMINAFPPKIQRKPENGESKKERKKERRREGKKRERKGGGLNVHQPTRPERPPHRAAWMAGGLNVHTPSVPSFRRKCVVAASRLPPTAATTQIFVRFVLYTGVAVPLILIDVWQSPAIFIYVKAFTWQIHESRKNLWAILLVGLVHTYTVILTFLWCRKKYHNYDWPDFLHRRKQSSRW